MYKILIHKIIIAIAATLWLPVMIVCFLITHIVTKLFNLTADVMDKLMKEYIDL